MFKNILQIYSLLICAIIVIAVLITICSALKTITSLMLEEYPRYVNYFDNNEEFLSHYGNNNEHLKTLSTLEINKKREEYRVKYIESTKKLHKFDLINNIGYLVIFAIFLGIHIRIYRYSNKLVV